MNIPENLALLCIAVIYGANYPIALYLMDSSTALLSMDLVLLRGLITAFLTFTCCYFINKKHIRPKSIERKDLPKFLMAGILGITIGMPSFFEGLRIVGAINAALLHLSTPLFILLFSIIFRQERYTHRKALGMTMGFVGALALTIKGNTIEISNLYGTFLMLLSSVTWAAYIVMLKHLNTKYKSKIKYSHWFVLNWSFIFGTVGLLVFLPLCTSFTYEGFLSIEWQGFSQATWLYLLFVVGIATFLSNLLKNYSLKQLNPSKNAIFAYLRVVFTILISLYFFKHDLSGLFEFYSISAIIFILLGLYFVSFNEANELNRVKLFFARRSDN